MSNWLERSELLISPDKLAKLKKAHVLGERLLDINPGLKLNIVQEFVLPERVWTLLEEYKPDYVMDCIDSVTPKLELIIACKRL